MENSVVYNGYTESDIGLKSVAVIIALYAWSNNTVPLKDRLLPASVASGN